MERGVRDGLGHRFAAAWVRVLAAFGDGYALLQPSEQFCIVEQVAIAGTIHGRKDQAVSALYHPLDHPRSSTPFGAVCFPTSSLQSNGIGCRQTSGW